MELRKQPVIYSMSSSRYQTSVERLKEIGQFKMHGVTVHVIDIYNQEEKKKSGQ